MTESTRARTVVWGLIGLIYAGLTIGVILTRSPWWDEGQLADPAHTLAQHGYLGSTIMSGKGHPLVREFVGYDRYTYWTVPFYFVVLAGWIKLVGFSFVSIRMLSALCGAGLIVAGASLVGRLTGSRFSGMLVAVFLATDYTLVLSAATARMDMMSAALGFGGIAAYVALRDRRLRAAAFVGGALAAAACFVHPVGVLHTGGLLLTAVYLDRRRLRVADYCVAAIPYFVFAGLWGLYIAQSPETFWSQFRAHTSYRVGGFTSPVRAVLDDVVDRYIRFFTPQGKGAAKLGILVMYGAGIAAALFAGRVRRAPGVLLLLLLSGLYYVELAVLDEAQFPHYMVHVITVWALLLAAVAGVAYSEKLVPAAVLSVVLGGFVLLQIGGNLLRIRQNTYRNEYLPAVAFVEQHSDAAALVMGPSQLLFGLKDRRLVDDARLGGLTGAAPDVIVVDPFHRAPEIFEGREPDMARYTAEMLTKKFFLAATYGDYGVYLPAAGAGRSK